ncbi:MAG: ImmA/IrrE family metallo-endopeptidase [Clostridia bacterium]|nr:ImmA/IrrE family metallo-endopeptidase [Clostridia bacterium]
MNKINNRLEELTSNILLDNDMYKIPVDILKIAKINDIEVYEGDLDKKISGAIRYDKENKKFAILLNKNDSAVRQRFTIAHELGHYFLHRNILENDEIHIDTMYRMPDEKEKEVDYFAGALLMNKILLEKMYEENTSITELAQIFKVSISAMTVRLDVLNLL